VLYRLLRATVPPLLRRFWRLRVEGVERLPPGAAIVVANHDSLADPFVVGSAIDRPLRYLAKAELWRNALVRRAVDALGAIPVERGRGDIAAVALDGDRAERVHRTADERVPPELGLREDRKSTRLNSSHQI